MTTYSIGGSGLRTQSRFHRNCYTHLDERLDLAPPLHLLLAHTVRHFSGVAFDTGDDGMGVGPLLGTLIELLDDDDLVASWAALLKGAGLELGIGAGNFEKIRFTEVWMAGEDLPTEDRGGCWKRGV